MKAGCERFAVDAMEAIARRQLAQRALALSTELLMARLASENLEGIGAVGIRGHRHYSHDVGGHHGAWKGAITWKF